MLKLLRYLLCFTVAGQEENLYAKKNYDKYLSALKNSGLVSAEEKAQGATADVTAGAEGGAGTMVLLGRITHLSAVIQNTFHQKQSNCVNVMCSILHHTTVI